MALGKADPTLLIAGPGAGKTTEMVQEIIGAMPHLKRNRVLATITYTNAATETIRTRLSHSTYIPRNIFISTTHRFFNQFIVIPYASIFQDIGLEKLFLDIDIDHIAEGMVVKKDNSFYPVKNKIRGTILNKLLKDGKIPLNQVGTIAAKLMDIKEVSEVVSRRLQFLFIDEFQDADTSQYRVFDQIRKNGHTQIFAVGDPEQYIAGFTYRGRPGKMPSISGLPISKFKATPKYKQDNHRAYEQLVRFINSFRCDIEQKSVKGNHPEAAVVFIESGDVEQIIQAYQSLCSKLKINKHSSDQGLSFFYLSFQNATFEREAAKFGLLPLVAGNNRYSGTTLDDALEIICAAVGKTGRQICQLWGVDGLGFRKLGVRLIDAVAKDVVSDESSLNTFIIGMLGTINNEPDSAQTKILLHNLCLRVKSLSKTQTGHLFSSIHRAKGLEADAVLVVAETTNQLDRWLITVKEKRMADKSDMCRIGYVGFSRAKVLLCIGCLKPLGPGLRKRLLDLGVKIYLPENAVQLQEGTGILGT